jgi:hypothetical protein
MKRSISGTAKEDFPCRFLNTRAASHNAPSIWLTWLGLNGFCSGQAGGVVFEGSVPRDECRWLAVPAHVDEDPSGAEHRAPECHRPARAIVAAWVFPRPIREPSQSAQAEAKSVSPGGEYREAGGMEGYDSRGRLHRHRGEAELQRAGFPTRRALRTV